MKKFWLGLALALASCAAPALAYTPPLTATAPITLSTSGVIACPTCGTTAGTVTSVSVTAHTGVTGTVATATTTPAISITLGAITPTSVTATGALSGTSGTFSTTLGVTGNSTLTGLVGIGQAPGADALDVTGNANIGGTGIFTAITGNFLNSAGNGVLTVSGQKTSGNGAGLRIRNATDGTIGYAAEDSYLNGGTNYAQYDLQAAQATGTVCISGGGLSACGITVGATNSILIGNASTHAGQAACYTTSGQMGYCTTVVGASGGCTCTGF